MTDFQDTGEIIELFGVSFVGKRDLTTGRIYVASTPESKAALTVLKLKGEKEIRAQSKESDATSCQPPIDVVG